MGFAFAINPKFCFWAKTSMNNGGIKREGKHAGDGVHNLTLYDPGGRACWKGNKQTRH